MIPLLPSLAKLNSQFDYLKKPLFYNCKTALVLKDLSFTFYLDINSQDKVMTAGAELKDASSSQKAYFELFCRSLIGQDISDLRIFSQKEFFKRLEVQDQKKLNPLFPVLNPAFLALEKSLEKFVGDDLAITKLASTQDDLLCLCENITKAEFMSELEKNKTNFKKAMGSLNIASSCGRCLFESESLFDKALLQSYFLEERSYAEWVLELDDFFKLKAQEIPELKDYIFDILSFENLLLKIKVKRGNVLLKRPALLAQVQKWVHEQKNARIEVSLIF